MPFRMLSGLVVELQQAAAVEPLQGKSLFDRALQLMIRNYPHMVPAANALRTAAHRHQLPLALAAGALPPELRAPGGLVNACALALSMPRVTVHEVGADVIRLCDETDLHELPGEPPRLLRAPWLIEARDVKTPLVGSTVSIGGYAIGDTWFIVALNHPDGLYLAQWSPHWNEPIVADAPTDLAALVGRSSLVDGSPSQDGRDISINIIRFVATLGLLLDAEGAPVKIEHSRNETKRRKGRRHIHDAVVGWTTRYVSLTEPATAIPTEFSGLGGTGSEVAVVPVRGHLKMQRHGPGGSLRKIMWVEGYSARRWISPRPKRIVIN